MRKKDILKETTFSFVNTSTFCNILPESPEIKWDRNLNDSTNKVTKHYTWQLNIYDELTFWQTVLQQKKLTLDDISNNTFVNFCSIILVFQFQKFFLLIKTFFPTLGQNNFGNKIPFGYKQTLAWLHCNKARKSGSTCVYEISNY